MEFSFKKSPRPSQVGQKQNEEISVKAAVRNPLSNKRLFPDLPSLKFMNPLLEVKSDIISLRLKLAILIKANISECDVLP